MKTMAVVLAGLSLAACSDVDIPQAATTPKVEDLAMTQDGRNVTLTWTLPQADGLLGVRVDKNGALQAELDAPASSYLARHIEKNMDVFFTVKARYADGRMSEGSTVKARYDADFAPAAMLLPQADEATLDDDEPGRPRVVPRELRRRQGAYACRDGGRRHYARQVWRDMDTG